MFSTLFGGSPIDEQIARATSENLPSEQPDIALNLEICDQIRCKRLGAKEVCASIRKRLRHSNPNVQLLTLSLLDVCVKNGGNHFLVEVASREFMDDLVSILKQPAGINNQVKTKMLELIQVWAETFKGRPELSYTAQIYGALKAQGYDFPPKVEAIAAMIDTQTAPEWTDNDVCMRCRTAFTFTNRKHHCRNCGQIFCHTCSNNKEALPQFGIPEPVRVCTGCYLKLRAASVEPSTLSLSEFMASETPKMTPSEPAAPRLTSNSILAQSSDEMDEDLKRAIELSLQETKQDAPTKPKASAHPSSTATRVQESEEDADLAAAIAASLKDLKVREPCTGMYPDPSEIQSSRGRTTPDDPTQSYGQYQADIPNFSLTEKETQNILLFSKLVDSLKQSGDPIPDAGVHNLYAELGNLGPKLSYSLKDTLLKHRKFLEIQHRLTSAIKLYDSQLERSAAISSKSNAYPPKYEVPLSHSHASLYPHLGGRAPQVPAYTQPPMFYPDSAHVLPTFPCAPPGASRSYSSHPPAQPEGGPLQPSYLPPAQPEALPYHTYSQPPQRETAPSYPAYASPTQHETAQSHSVPHPPQHLVGQPHQAALAGYEHGVPNAPYLSHVPSPMTQDPDQNTHYQPPTQGVPYGYPDYWYAATASHPQYPPGGSQMQPPLPNSAWSTAPVASHHSMHSPHYAGAPAVQTPLPRTAPVPEAPLIDL